MRARAATWVGASSSAKHKGDDVWFVCKGGTVPGDLPPLLAGMLQKRGGSHGGKSNWKGRWCQLIGSTLYYSESPVKAADCKGHIKLVGLAVRRADMEVYKEGAICLYWPEQPRLAFYILAPSAQSQGEWIHQLRAATNPTPLALGELSLQELSQRCLNCGAFVERAGGRPTIESALAKCILSVERKARETEHSEGALLQRALDTSDTRASSASIVPPVQRAPASSCNTPYGAGAVPSQSAIGGAAARTSWEASVQAARTSWEASVQDSSEDSSEDEEVGDTLPELQTRPLSNSAPDLTDRIRAAGPLSNSAPDTTDRVRAAGPRERKSIVVAEMQTAMSAKRESVRDLVRNLNLDRQNESDTQHQPRISFADGPKLHNHRSSHV